MRGVLNGGDHGRTHHHPSELTERSWSGAWLADWQEEASPSGMKST